MKRIVIAALVLLALASCSKPKSQETLELTYGGQLYPEDYLIQGGNFFGKYGLTVKANLFSSGTEGNEALISGVVDVNSASDSKSVALFNALGQDVVIVGTAQRGDRYTTIVRADSSYTDWSQLKGKKVATRYGTGAEFVLHRFFDSRDDLAWEDFQWVNMKTEDMIAALDNKQIEAFTVWAPTPEISEALGVGKAMLSYGKYALTPVLLHVKASVLEKKRDAVVRFLAGLLDRYDMIQGKGAEAAVVAAKAASAGGATIDPKAFELAFRRIDFSLDVDQAILGELKSTAETLLRNKKIEAVPDFRVDMSVLADAKVLRSKR